MATFVKKTYLVLLQDKTGSFFGSFLSNQVPSTESIVGSENNFRSCSRILKILHEKFYKILSSFLSEFLLEKGVRNDFDKLSCQKVTHFEFSEIPKNASLLGTNFGRISRKFRESFKMRHFLARQCTRIWWNFEFSRGHSPGPSVHSVWDVKLDGQNWTL